jgi:glutamate 5-kinase
MGGTILINNAAGRALRKKRADVRAADVLDCVGGFQAGDTVYVTFRGVDGGQFVVATGTVRCDESALRGMTARSNGDRVNASDDANIVIRAQDMDLLWPPFVE